MTVKPKYLVIEGNIGAGKTSLARKLASEYNVKPVLEQFTENNLLPKFYQHPEKYAFPLELSFLHARFRQLEETFNDMKDSYVISDYHIMKCRVFANVNLNEQEADIFNSYYDILSSMLPEPDTVLFLDPGIERLKSHISLRGRDMEKGITESYLLRLQKQYANWLDSHLIKRVIKVESSELDFINNENDYKFIINLLNTEN